MKKGFLLLLFFSSLALLTWERLADLFLLWMPGVDVSKESLHWALENSNIYLFQILVSILVLSGLLSLSLFKNPFHRTLITTLLCYGLFEVVLVDPFWLITLYTLFVFLGFLLHYSLDEGAFRLFLTPIISYFGKGGWRLFPIPILCSLFTLSSLYDTGLPVELRTVHPAPPEEITFKGETLKVKELENPFRKYESSDPELFEKYLYEGGVVFFTKCFFCHGALLDGNGHLARAFHPRPADFTDPGTIAQLEESYVFWRVAKGGIGLPRQSAPWNSAMPAWEEELTAEEIWKVILYIYDASGQRPKTF